MTAGDTDTFFLVTSWVPLPGIPLAAATTTVVDGPTVPPPLPMAPFTALSFPSLVVAQVVGATTSLAPPVPALMRVSLHDGQLVRGIFVAFD
jgi:hypothetical protein